MKKFEVGRAYQARDGMHYVVLKRSAKRMSITNKFGEITTVGIKTDKHRGEWAFPEGKYSQCPVIWGERFVDTDHASDWKLSPPFVGTSEV